MHPTIAFDYSGFGFVFGLAGMGIGLVFGVLGMYFAHRRRVMWHETARIALEKGQRPGR